MTSSWRKCNSVDALWRMYASMSWVFIGLDNSVSPVRHQTISRTNINLLPIGSWGRNFSKIKTNMQPFLFNKSVWICRQQNVNHSNIDSESTKIVSTFSTSRWYFRDYFVYALRQWETTLHYNVVPHWLGAYTKRSLIFRTLPCDFINRKCQDYVYVKWENWSTM